MGDLTAKELAHLLGLATRRVHELEAEVERLRAARAPGPETRRVIAFARAVVGPGGAAWSRASRAMFAAFIAECEAAYPERLDTPGPAE